jgi:hypothetical protein
MSLIEKLHDKWWRLKRYILTIRVDIYPTSKYFPAQGKVTLIWFDKYKSVVEEFRVPMASPGVVDLGPVFDEVPRFHKLWVHYEDLEEISGRPPF